MTLRSSQFPTYPTLISAVRWLYRPEHFMKFIALAMTLAPASSGSNIAFDEHKWAPYPFDARQEWRRAAYPVISARLSSLDDDATRTARDDNVLGA